MIGMKYKIKVFGSKKTKGINSITKIGNDYACLIYFGLSFDKKKYII